MSHPSSLLPVAPLPTGTLTFVFTDIEGSTQLWERHPQAMPAALARHDAILRQVIESHGGVVFKTVGDGVHAAFAYGKLAVQSRTQALARARELNLI
jgi:class 3 adenylate cyclase